MLRGDAGVLGSTARPRLDLAGEIGAEAFDALSGAGFVEGLAERGNFSAAPITIRIEEIC